MIAGPNGTLKHFKKCGSWECACSLTPPTPLKKIVSNYKDLLVGISETGELMYYNNSEDRFKFILPYESRFNDVCLIYPNGDHIVTLQHNREITSWEVLTGEMKDMMVLTQKALAIKENPEYPYIGVGYSNGVLELFSLYDPSNITSMTKFNLSKNPLNSIYFTELSKLIVAADTISGEFFILEEIPGTKMRIIYTLETNRQICDYILIASRTCLRLFTIYVTSDLYIAGDKIARYCIIRDKPDVDLKVYDLESNSQMYSKLYATRKPNRDRVFYAIPITTKKIHEISTKRADNLARLTDSIETLHQMKKIALHIDQHHVVSCAYDGLVIIRTVDFKEVKAIIMPHYRNYGGVAKAYVDPLGKCVISLGRDNTLTCISLTDIEVNQTKQEVLHELHTRLEAMFARPTYGLAPTGELEGKTWFEVEKINKEIRERIACAQERHDILLEFTKIQYEIKELLTKNLEGPENERLDIQEFNLDIALKQEKTLQSQEECKRTKQYLEALIVAQDNVSKWIKQFCWNPMKVQGQDLGAIFEEFIVENYVLLDHDVGFTTNTLEVVTELRNLEQNMSKGDSLEPWVPKTVSQLNLQLEQAPKLSKAERGVNLLEVLEEEENINEDLIDEDTETAFKGSVCHSYIKLHEGHYSQMQVQSFLQTYISRMHSLVEIKKVKEYFNKVFNDMMNTKTREMGLITERNARLRHIISEINYFSVDQIDIVVVDPPWRPNEFPERILTVDDSEIFTTPYISPSTQAILDAKAAEAERIRLLLLADDFRERALMAMMNGVLEVRWEDELRKDVPLPKCMIDKAPETFNEDDLRAVRDYEEAVKFLNSERERYKKLLNAEYAKIGGIVRDSVKKFNKKLADCYLTKLLVDSGIKQENLRISRQQLKNHERVMLNKSELHIVQNLKNNHEESVRLHDKISSFQEVLKELKLQLENLQVKDKLLEKGFKKDFADASSVVQEQCAKLYKRRPKVSIRIIPTVALTLEAARTLMSQEKTILLTSECLEFLKSADLLDQYVNVPPAVDEHYYAIVCRHRRMKIEMELKARALQLDIQDAEYTISQSQKRLHQLKEDSQQLVLHLEEVRNKRMELFHNIEIQLVLKQGLVEIPLSGSITDFDNAVLVNRKDIETINRIILKGGNKKIKAMKETMNFRRNIIAMEWEHRRLQMKIADLKTNYQEVEGIKVTKDIQNYLKFKARGYSLERGLSFEDEIDMQKAAFEKIIQEKKDKVNELQQSINNVKKENRKLDDEIAAVNVDVCEYQLEKDYEMEEREKNIIKIRMKTLVKRSLLVKQIQKNHSDILMLQTELELLRLKTYPTLSYTILTD
ncbi:cilia- and flagella-associated protein 43 isoform X2 [Photinus pyralis]|nr:cilia- and flagella-associated protein 43 isoform X2 [Photinus pyralis]